MPTRKTSNIKKGTFILNDASQVNVSVMTSANGEPSYTVDLLTKPSEKQEVEAIETFKEFQNLAISKNMPDTLSTEQKKHLASFIIPIYLESNLDIKQGATEVLHEDDEVRVIFYPQTSDESFEEWESSAKEFIVKSTCDNLTQNGFNESPIDDALTVDLILS